MNQGIYQLVFSRVLNMLVPVSEAARNRNGKTSKRNKKTSQTMLAFTLLISFVQTHFVMAETVLPAGISIRTIDTTKIGITSSDANNINFKQIANTAVIDYNRLNLNAGQNFNVDMLRGQTLLNRIHDLNGSILNGNVNGKGNLYFINTNGIIFGANAQFNVGSIYAGTLNITDELFNGGFINSDNTFKAVFNAVGEIATANPASLIIESGAKINVDKGGKVVLFSEDIRNSGIINTPDGQTILAAGKTVYLAGSKDPAGFMVEVNGGGTATNLGTIVAERGNITMMGLAVNQQGTLRATTSVRANGSIFLLAQDSADLSNVDPVGLRDGIVTLAKNSVTEVTPDITDKEEISRQQAFDYFIKDASGALVKEAGTGTLKKSEIKIEASLVNIDGLVAAKSGAVTVSARLNNAAAKLASPVKQRIYLGENAKIDVSGVDAIAPMSRNQIDPELFSDQNKDNPILRDSGLNKAQVYIDLRKGTELIDLVPFEKLKTVTLNEALTDAGSIKLETPADLIVRKGVVLDVSGGSTIFEAGGIKETNLYYNGELVPISEAKKGVPYDQVTDIYADKDQKTGFAQTWATGGSDSRGWGDISRDLSKTTLRTLIVPTQVESYLQGGDAGVLDLTIPGENTFTKNLVLAGQLLANTKTGTQQLINQKVPTFGELFASANQLVIAKTAKDLVAGFLPNQVLEDSDTFESVISADFSKNGFNNIDFGKVGKLTVDEALTIAPKGELVLGGLVNGISEAQINANIIAAGSNVKFGSISTTVKDNVTISTAGIFTNDRAGIAGQYSGAPAIDGGNIVAKNITFGKNVVLNASAGASVNSNGIVALGHAGDISFEGNPVDAKNLTLSSYGFAQGGKLKVDFIDRNFNNLNLNIAGEPNIDGANTINIDNAFFSRGGFSEINLAGLNINIGDKNAPQQEIYAKAQTWQLDSGFTNLAGTATFTDIASTGTKPNAIPQPVSLTFTANKFGIGADEFGGILTLAENTAIRTDRGGSVSLLAGKQINVLGDIATPSGSINLNINDVDLTLLEDPKQVIFIGEKATLSAAGSTLTLPDSQSGLLKTQVFNAGSININKQLPQNRDLTLDKQKGALIIKQGALLDVSGATIANDLKTTTGIERVNLYGDAGTINLVGISSLLIDGDLNAKADGTGRDGTLNLTFAPEAFNTENLYPNNSGTFVITQNKQAQAVNFLQGDAIKPSIASGEIPSETDTALLKAQISAEQIEQAGFANVNVKSYRVNAAQSSAIDLAGNVNLKINGNLTLDTPIINVKDNGLAELSANHITFKSPALAADVAALNSGTGQLTTQSSQAYIDGVTVIAGVNKTTINTTQDIHGQGTMLANNDITLNARQIYPSTPIVTGSALPDELRFEAVGEASKITINNNGAAPKPILSANGNLKFKADDIVQNGNLTAPFGTISFDGAESVTLTAASKTSISANKLTIPFLQTIEGGTKISPLGKNLVEKRIDVVSKKVDLQKDAVLDLSSTGNMFAYQFISGLGGSKDVLNQPNTYAVIPNIGNEFAPVDPSLINNKQAVGVGESVFLTGVPGLATGTYTLLPAYYALVPGAFMVQAKQTANLLPGATAPQFEGATLSSGYFADAGTLARDANWSTFKVTDGAIFRPAAGAISKASSQYLLTNLNDFFSNPLNTNGQKLGLPIDAGKLSLNAASLKLDATVIANKGKNGSGLQVEIASDNIRVVSNNDSTDATSLQLTANNINNLNAESVLLGGTFERDKDGINQIRTTANNVSIENNSNNVIKTPTFIATAKDSVTVKTGAAVNTGLATKTPAQLKLGTEGAGALLALSSASNINYSRIGGANAAQGSLNIESGSTLQAGNSIVLDATKQANLDSNVALQDNGSATLGANRILIGNAPIDTVGLNVNVASLAALGQLKSLTLNSYGNVDTFGAINFGNNQLDLTIDAAGVTGNLALGETAASALASAQPITITAKNLTLKNTLGATLAEPIDASNRDLVINANSVKLEGKLDSNINANAGKTAIAGYNQLTINTDVLSVANTGETSFKVANTQLNTGVVTGETGAKFVITGQNLNLAKLANAKSVEQAGFGANLTLEADNLTVASNIDLASGKLSLTSKLGDLNLENDANITAKSNSVKFDIAQVHSNAGSVTLKSNTGNVNVKSGALVDVSSQGNANSGKVQVLAASGSLNLDGQFKGSATGTGKGGVLEVDVDTLANFSTTDKQVIGFDEARQYRVRTGDVAITGTGSDALKARKVGVFADAGKVTVSGDIIATAPKNSRIDVYGNKGVTLTSAAVLKANSTKAGEEGGKVNIGSMADVADDTPDLLNFEAFSKVDVSGGEGGVGGEVNIIAPRTLDNTDVEISKMATTFTGVRDRVKIVANSVINTAVIDEANREAAIDSTNSFMLSAITSTTDISNAKGLQRLGLTDNPNIAITPGVEFRNETGNLTLNSDWSLHDWRYDPTTGARVTDAALLATGKNADKKTLLAGVLSLRARDNININGTLSDGFERSDLVGAIVPGTPEVEAVLDDSGFVITPAIPAIPSSTDFADVQGIDSWSYNIVSGADFAGANPLAVESIATQESTISATKAIVTKVTIANTPNSPVKLVAGIPDYKLDDASVIALRFSEIAIPSNARAGSSTTLNVSSTGEKALLKSDGAAVKKSDLTTGVTYFAKYDIASNKYKLIDAPDTSDVFLANNKAIRTGTGSINIDAAGDLVMVKDTNNDLSLRKSDAVIYTAGRVADNLAGFNAPTADLNPVYLTDGGDINIITKGNIVGGESTKNNRQLINQWLFRQGGGSDSRDTTVWVRPDMFKQGTATLGGGNISVNAGKNISNFSVSAPTTARYDSNGKTGNQTIDGGGDVDVMAAGDITNGVYFVAKGDGKIEAGGTIKKTSATFGTTLALQDGQFNVQTGKDAYIETVINPTLIAQSKLNDGKNDFINVQGFSSYFNTYSDSAKVSVSSLLGNVDFGQDPIAGIRTNLTDRKDTDIPLQIGLRYYPSQVNTIAFNGDVTFGTGATDAPAVLLPSSTGVFKLLAAKNVKLANVIMSDANLKGSADVNNPLDRNKFKNFNAALNSHAPELLHKDSVEPVMVIANQGDISSVKNTDIVTLPKFARFVAGNDISALQLNIQNNNPGDISLIKAGNNVKTKDVNISGPGELLVQASRNIDLRLDEGGTTISALGNAGKTSSNKANVIISNPALPTNGASITLQAGLGKGANVQGYIDQYILPTGSGPAVLKGKVDELDTYKESTANYLTNYMIPNKLKVQITDKVDALLADGRKTKVLTPTETLVFAKVKLALLEEALTLFNGSSLEFKTIFANRHVSTELVASALGFGKAGNHDRGNSALATLFPTQNSGDVLLPDSKISTNSRGSIDVLAPGGKIIVGAPGVANAGSGSEIGVITEKGGPIRMIADGNIDVNLSKVITQFGSDIVMWSNTGTIDAGKGAKSATSTPERIVQTDAFGNTFVEVRGVATGSGIRAQSYDPDGPNGLEEEPKKGNVYLVAPVVDAGEAGIEAGDLVIVAPIVLNAANIQVQGASSGVPIAATAGLSGVSAGLSPDAVNSATSAVTQSVSQAGNQQAFVKPVLPSIVNVEVISIGN